MTQQDTDTAKNNEAVLAGVPTEWPGAFGIYKYSKQAVKFNLGTILLLGLGSIVFSSATEWKLGFAGQIISLVAGALFTASLTLAYLAGSRKQKLPLEASIKKGWPYLLNMVLYTILVTLIAFGSLLLLIVPFFIVLPRLVLANYFLIDKKLGPWESIKASWTASQGHASKVWGIFGVNMLMILLIFTIIGIPVAIYLLIMYSGALAVLYESLHKHGAATPKE